MDRPTTVRDALDLAEAALREAVILQHTASRGPTLDDIAETNLYAWGGSFTVLAEQIEQACRLLRPQIADLGARAPLRDDAGMPVDERLELSAARLEEVGGYAVSLAGRARRYHAEVGHIGLEFPPDDEDVQR